MLQICYSNAVIAMTFRISVKIYKKKKLFTDVLEQVQPTAGPAHGGSAADRAPAEPGLKSMCQQVVDYLVAHRRLTAR